MVVQITGAFPLMGDMGEVTPGNNRLFHLLHYFPVNQLVTFIPFLEVTMVHN